MRKLLYVRSGPRFTQKSIQALLLRIRVRKSTVLILHFVFYNLPITFPSHLSDLLDDSAGNEGVEWRLMLRVPLLVPVLYSEEDEEHPYFHRGKR